MTRFHGKVGYGVSVEAPEGSGVWVDDILELPYYGDVIKDTRALEAGGGLNDNIKVGNSISVLADEYAISNFRNIKYVEWAGAFWTVPTVEVRPPRLILNIGNVYNGPTCSTS